VGDLAEFVNLSITCVDPKSGKKWPDETGNMCDTCEPACTLSNAGAGPSPGPSPEGDSGFCRTTALGTGVTMYMDGFKLTSATPEEACVNFLMPSLVIDTPWKLIVSCLGVVALSAFVELCTLGRRFLPKKRQGDVGLIFHVVSLVLAYVAMLFVMTYSLELFSSVIIGLALGHKLAGTVARSKAFAEDLAAGSPCCRLSQGLDAPVSASPSLRAGGATDGDSIEPTPSMRPTAGLTTLRLSVKGMTCNVCTETVRRALESCEGVNRASVSLEDARATVLCKPSCCIAGRLCEAGTNVGFETTQLDD
jgi:copper chaperone CopZ